VITNRSPAIASSRYSERCWRSSRAATDQTSHNATSLHLRGVGDSGPRHTKRGI
jgi:hypothetical protein